MTSLCWSPGVGSSCPNYALGPHAVKNAQIHTYVQGGRGDIWYMRAMINRLIRNGLIKFTLHIKTGSTCDSPYPECVRDLQRVCSAHTNQQGPQSIYPAVIRAISLSDRWAAKWLAQTRLFISIPKELRWRAPLCSAKVASNSSMSE